MNFLKRIGYGWLLFTESFFSIFNQHTNLTKIARLILLAVFLLFSIAHMASIALPILDYLQTQHIPVASNVSVFLRIFYIIMSLGGLLPLFVFSSMYAALYIYFSAFLQKQNLTLRAVFERVIPHMGYILLWVLINGVIRDLITRSAHMLPSWSYTLSSAITVPIIDILLLWSWMSLFVLTSIVLDNAGIIRALKTSIRVALQKTPELIGFVLWSITIGFLLLLFVGFVLAFLNLEYIPWFVRIFGWYGVTLLFALLLFAYALFIVVLYLSSTGRLVSGLGDRRLQEYFSQQAQQNTPTVLQD